jgi:pimeloyl-ACP methyl ester carboxylesterase
MDLTLPDIMLFYLFCEILFYIHFRYQLDRIEKRKSRKVAVSLAAREKHLAKIIHLVNLHGPSVIAGWFVLPETRRPFSCNRVCGDLSEFFSWAFWDVRFASLDSTDRIWVIDAVDRVVRETGIDYWPGEGGVLLRNSSDPMVVSPRPLLLYLIVILLKFFSGIYLRILGFSPGERAGVEFWYRKGSKKSEEPVVFFHGISPGLGFYLPLLMSLKGEALIIELPWISMSIGKEPPLEPLRFSDRILDLFIDLGIGKDRRMVLCGHSYGSAPVAWLLRQNPKLNCRVVLVDPVTICLLVPKVCFAFLYDRPDSFIGHLVRVWAAEEIGVAQTMRKHFYWMDCAQYVDELPADSFVFLSEKDHLVPVEIVYAECKDADHITVVVFPDTGHGGPFLNLKHTGKVVRAISDCTVNTYVK